MSNPAIIDDVADSWRPLTDAEEITVQTWLDQAWNKLQALIPGIETRMSTDPVLTANVVTTLVDAVIRRARNPEGFKQQTVAVDDASRSWTRDDTVASGALYFTQAELSLLTPSSTGRGRVFSVLPS